MGHENAYGVSKPSQQEVLPDLTLGKKYILDRDVYGDAHLEERNGSRGQYARQIRRERILRQGEIVELEGFTSRKTSELSLGSGPWQATSEGDILIIQLQCSTRTWLKDVTHEQGMILEDKLSRLKETDCVRVINGRGRVLEVQKSMFERAVSDAK